MTPTTSLRLEDFIQAVQSQLDNAQAAMALKAHNANLPLTFAIKDVNLDLRAHVDFADSEIRIRPAGAGDGETSLFHLVFTTITRPAIDENARAFADGNDDDGQSLDTVSELSNEDRRRLEWAGVRTVRQLQQVEERGKVGSVGRITNLPLDRLRSALTRVSAPEVRRIEPVPIDSADGNPGGPPLLRVLGRNLVRQGQPPRVQIGNRPVAILKSSPDELLVAPDDGQWAGEISVEPAPQRATAMSFDLSAFAPISEPSSAAIGAAPLLRETGAVPPEQLQ